MSRVGNWELSKMAACRQLGFGVTGNSAIRSADPENPILQPNIKVYRIIRCGDMAIRVCWEHMEPPFGGRRCRGGSAMAPLKRAMVVSYRLSIVTIRPQLAIECLRRSNQQGVGHFGPKFPRGDRQTDRQHAIARPRFALTCIAR